MTKGEFLAMLARRLGEPLRHVERHVEAMHSAGIVRPVPGSRRYPPEIAEPEAVAVLLGLVGATKIDDAPAASQRLGALTDADGNALASVLAEVLFGKPVNVGHLIVRPTSATMTIGGLHRRYGDPSNEPARFVDGRTLMAIAAELRGIKPHEADAMAALAAIR